MLSIQAILTQRRQFSFSRFLLTTNNAKQWVTVFDPWPATHDYSRVMTPDYCSFQSGPLSGSALKIKHHHSHKILRWNNWNKLTLWLKLCRKSLQCLKKTKSWVTGTDTLTHVTHSDLLTHLTRDPWPADPAMSAVLAVARWRRAPSLPGARRRGRPRTAWMDNIKTWTGLSVEESVRMTEDRDDKWSKHVHGVANRRIEDG